MSKRQRKHNHVVSSVLAAALAFTAIVSSVQLASVSDDLAANVGGRYVADATCPDGSPMPTDGSMCPAASGGGGGGGTIPCNSLNGQQVTTAVCGDADSRKAACQSPSTWDGTGSGTCIASGSGTGGSTTNVTCPNGSVHTSPYTCTPQENCATGTTWNGTSCTTGGAVGGGASSYVTQSTCTEHAYFWSPTKNTCYSTQLEKTNAESGGTTANQTCSGATPFKWGDGSCHASVETVGGGASSYVTQSTCAGAYYFWSTIKNTCYSTQLEKTNAESGGTTTNQTCSGATPFKWADGSCHASVETSTVGTQCGQDQVWDYATSSCKTQSAANCPQGQYYNGISCVTSTNNYNTGAVVDTVGACTERGGQWTASTSTCSVGSTTGTQYTNTNMDSASTRTFWCFSLGKMATATECDAGDAASGSKPAMTGAMTGTMPKCENGQYFDFAAQACKQMKNFETFSTEDHFDVFQGDFQCPEWDTYCQQKMEGGMMGAEGFGQDFGDVQCLQNPKDITRMQKEIARDVADIEKRFQEVDLTQLSDSYRAAEIKSALDTLKELGSSSDGCDIANAGELRGKFFGGPDGEEGYMRQLDGVGELARFRKELGRISKEIATEKTRMKGEEALGYLTQAEALVAELGANPSFDPEQPWTIWEQLDPECMRGGFGGGFGGGGGMPSFACTDDELKGTVRGLMMLARKSADAGRFKNFEGNICEEAERGIGDAEGFLLPQLTGTAKAEAEKLIATGKQAVEKCKTDKDKVKYAKIFEKMQQQFMSIVESAGIDFGDQDFGDDEFSFDDFGFSNTDDLVGKDIMAKINALIDAKFAELEKKLMSNVQRLFEEKLTQMATVFRQTVIDSLASLVDVLDDEIADDLASVIEFSTFVSDDRAQETANAKIEATVEVLEQTETIKQLAADNEEVADLVVEFQEKLAADPLPLEVVYEVQDVIEAALTVSENGGDAAVKLEQAIALVDDVSTEELHDALLLSGEWAIADVAPDTGVWYAREFANARDLGVLTGTPTEVEIDGETVEATNMRPGVVLNNAEGIAMAIKTYNSATGEDLPEASADALRLAGEAEWAAPYIQEYMDIAGKNDVDALFADGASASMVRQDLAIVMTTLLEEKAGRVEAAPEDTYEEAWKDSDRITDAEAQHALAVQYAVGAMTGANSGTEGQPTAEVTRDQAAKVFAEEFPTLQIAAVTGSVAIDSGQGN